MNIEQFIMAMHHSRNTKQVGADAEVSIYDNEEGDSVTEFTIIVTKDNRVILTPNYNLSTVIHLEGGPDKLHPVMAVNNPFDPLSVNDKELTLKQLRVKEQSLYTEYISARTRRQEAEKAK